MRFFSPLTAIVFVGASVVNAHFNISYPAVRGAFNDDNEVNFCDSYSNPSARSPFPLSNGLIAFITSHPSWTAGVMISTSSDPTSFSNFRNSSGGDQLAVPYFQSGGTSGCIAVNVSDSGLSGLNDGSNVTLQMVFNGGDGILYQCMDLTLSSSYQVPASVVSECQNQTKNSNASSATATISGVGSTPTNGGTMGRRETTGLFSILVSGVFAITLL